jgi:hypothetical protein
LIVKIYRDNGAEPPRPHVHQDGEDEIEDETGGQMADDDDDDGKRGRVPTYQHIVQFINEFILMKIFNFYSFPLKGDSDDDEVDTRRRHK